MKTYAFIGSDKNAGKTTALNFCYRQLYRRYSGQKTLCLTSIGINGEPVDTYEYKPKPSIRILKNTYFVTTGEQLQGLAGCYNVLHVFSGAQFPKPYSLVRALTDVTVVLEGPNSKTAVQTIKKIIRQLADNCICLIDGSADRQFLGHPSISDGICYALLLTERPEQRIKAERLLFALTLKSCTQGIKAVIDRQADQNLKSLLCLMNGEMIYSSGTVPFLDERLKTACLEHKDTPCFLYLNGSLSASLYGFFSPLLNLTLVLDSFTCYQNIPVVPGQEKSFKPVLVTYHTVPLTCLFLKQETDQARIDLPLAVPAYNLFRDEPHDLGI